MELFIRHKLVETQDGTTILLYIDPNLTEFAQELGQNEQKYYQVTKKDIYEGQYAPFGVSVLRHKGQHLLDKPVTMEEFKASQNQWNKDREALSK